VSNRSRPALRDGRDHKRPATMGTYRRYAVNRPLTAVTMRGSAVEPDPADGVGRSGLTGARQPSLNGPEKSAGYLDGLPFAGRLGVDPK
jgi:hypothetical protein